MTKKIKRGTIVYLGVLFLLPACIGNTGHKEQEQVRQVLEALKVRPFYLKGHIKGDLPSDTITLSFWKYFIRKDMGREDYTAIAKAGAFSFELPPLEHPGYFSLKVPGFSGKTKWDPLLEHYLVSPGDSILLDISDSRISFSGKGSEKYRIRYNMAQAVDHLERPAYLNGVTPENMEAMLAWLDSAYAVRHKVLEMHKAVLAEESYHVLYADLVGKKGYEKYFYYWLNSSQATGVWQDRLLALYKEKLRPGPANIKKPEVAALSKYFTDYLVLKARTDRRNGLLDPGNKGLPLKEEYLMLKGQYSGLLREKLLTYYLANKFARAGDQEALDYCFKDVLTFLTVPYFRKMMEKIYQNQKRGALAYNFSLPDTNGDTVQLDDFKGKLVFLDFWFTGCGACKIYARTLSDVHQAFKDNPEVVFMTISIDKEPEKWRRSVEGGQYTSTGTVNLYTAGKGSGHPLIGHYDVKGYPHPIIIDREGKIYKSSGLRLPAKDLIAIIKDALKETG